MKVMGMGWSLIQYGRQFTLSKIKIYKPMPMPMPMMLDARVLVNPDGVVMSWETCSHCK